MRGTTMRISIGRRAAPSGGALFAYDLLATALSIVLALMLRFETLDWALAVAPYLPAALLPILVRPPVRMAFGLYHREWRFASTRELGDIVASAVVGSGVILVVFASTLGLGLFEASAFPRSFFVIEPLITLGLVGGARFAFRMRIERSIASGSRRQFVRTLIYGAGEAGAGIARNSARNPRLGIHVVGFIDDNPRKHGSQLLGQRVHGDLDDLPTIVERTDARMLLIAMPSRNGLPVRRAVSAGHRLGLEVKTVPPIRDLLTGRIQVAQPRNISVEDLLRREPVKLDGEAIAHYLRGASVLVTGGGGSIGSELVRQILRFGPRVVTVLDYQEAALWNIERDAAPVLAGSGVRLNPVLADVRSAGDIAAILERAKPDVVFHAAALKHLPYVEMYPSQGVLTNVLGSRNVLEACEAARIPRFVLISTDKAVEPTSVMGFTKRIAELLTTEVGHRTGLAYSAVRFGNVLGSSGSLVPLLERQLDDGIPLTITDPEATRYFMTLGEAVTLILQAGAAAGPGEISVLDMGQPVRIGDLVEDVLRLRGIEDGKAEVKVIGLRPGEKLHEALFFADEHPEPTNYAGILRAVQDGHRAVLPGDGWIQRLGEMAEARDESGIRDAFHGLRGSRP